MSVQHIAHLTVGAHRGAARLWLQGRRLAAIGATPGRRFGVTQEGQQALSIEIREDGCRTVSAKEEGRVPVIDVGGRELEKVFPAGTRVRVTFEAGRIRVEVNPRDAAKARRLAALKEKLLFGQPLTTGALCLGAGLLDAAVKDGLEAGGVPSRMRFAVEREAAYLEHTSRTNPALRPDTITVEADLAEVDSAPLGKVDALVAGIPCTAASRAGRAKHRSMDPTLAHPEGHPEGCLFVDFLRFVVACEPAVVVLENVPPYRHTAGYAAIRATLAKLGYEVTDAILDASDWGCHERRERLVMVGAPVPVPLDGLAPGLAAGPLSGILEDVPAEDPRWRSHGAHAAKTAASLAGDGRNFKLQLVGP